MLYFAPILLVLVIQTTFVVIPALAHSTSEPRALPPPWKAFFEPPAIYIEVHPCAESFKAEHSKWYTATSLSFIKCLATKSASAWRTTKSMEVECIPIGEGDRPDRGSVTLDMGDCFIFHQPKELDRRSTDPTVAPAWAHPCDSTQKFDMIVSLWYTAWHHMDFDVCKKMPHAGAWKILSHCYVFPGPHSPINHKLSGICFVLDKITIHSSYVEVHPCDKFFLNEQSKFFTNTTQDHTQVSILNLKECSKQDNAVAWRTVPSAPVYKCIPIHIEIPEAEKELETEEGGCFRIIKTELPRFFREPADNGYRHVCDKGFNGQVSKWYTRLDDAMNIWQCSKMKGAAGWRTKNYRACVVFYLGREIKLDDFPKMEKEGHCYLRDKVVPLYSFPPSWRAHALGPTYLDGDLSSHDKAGLEGRQNFETHTPEYPFGYPYDVVGRS